MRSHSPQKPGSCHISSSGQNESALFILAQQMGVEASRPPATAPVGSSEKSATKVANTAHAPCATVTAVSAASSDEIIPGHIKANSVSRSPLRHVLMAGPDNVHREPMQLRLGTRSDILTL